MKFDLPKDSSNIIKVVGVGGGGSNAVNHMFLQGISGVDFLVCNTDQQALDTSPVPIKVQLGLSLTEGRGAGSIPEVGKNCALENIDDINSILSKNTKMVFITAGMGGGTGTGAAPVIARSAREMGVLTVGIVTMPFFFEGRKRRQQAEEGIEEMRQSVDTLLIINNEKLREMCGNMPVTQSFAMADNVLTTAARGIAEIITRTGYINVDFEDVRTVMKESGVAIMGSATANGENRALKAVEKALASPLLNDNNIQGARYVLLNITFGNQEVLMDEITEITDFIQEEAGATADVIWGYGMDEQLGDDLSVTLIATGFKQNPHTGVNTERSAEKRKVTLEEKSQNEPAKSIMPVNEPYLRSETSDARPAQPPVPTAPPQRVIEFELRKAEPTPPQAVPESPSEKPVVHKLETGNKPENSATPQPPAAPETPFVVRRVEEPHEENQPKGTDAAPRSQSEHLSRLRDMNLRLRNNADISHLEREPAFKRKAINLEDVPPANEPSASRFTLSEEEGEDGEKRTKLRNDNPFWSDQPD